MTPRAERLSPSPTARRLAAFACLWVLGGLAAADELRPAYLELREQSPGEFALLWKTPMQGDLRLALTPKFSGATVELTTVSTRQTAKSAAVQTWRLRAVEPLRGQTLRIAGLEGTRTDALVRIEFADGTVWMERLTAARSAAAIPLAQSASSVARAYVVLGIEHILLGTDHLLFVLGLMLLCSGVSRVVKTVTAFTFAHSITLALATLGFIDVPPAPVEALIALSIAFVAMEVIRVRQGQPSATARAPWLVAFSFGLLHGLGFAGALSEVGLPQGHIPLALLLFNVGVEVGQLLFVALAFACFAGLRRLRLPRWAPLVAPYVIGSIAMFWVAQRVAAY